MGFSSKVIQHQALRNCKDGRSDSPSFFSMLHVQSIDVPIRDGLPSMSKYPMTDRSEGISTLKVCLDEPASSQLHLFIKASDEVSKPALFLLFCLCSSVAGNHKAAMPSK